MEEKEIKKLITAQIKNEKDHLSKCQDAEMRTYIAGRIAGLELVLFVIKYEHDLQQTFEGE